MSRRQLVAGLEIGSFKTVSVIAQRYRNDQTHVLGLGTAPSSGIFRGQVVDVDAAAASIKTAIEHAQRAARAEIDRVCVGVSGSHLATTTETAEVLLRANERTFQHRHLQQLLARLTEGARRGDREIVYVSPLEFIVDGTARVNDPIGLSGRRLALKATVVTGVSGSLKNQAKALQQCGLEVDFALLQPYAAATACLDQEQIQSGVAVIDIGHSTTDVMAFQGGAFKLMHSIPIAGEAVTADVSKGLHVPVNVAEELKLSYGQLAGPDPGASLPAHSFRSQLIDVDASLLHEILEARYEDMLLRARTVLDEAGLIHHLAAGVVLTGGSCQITGLPNLASRVFDMPVDRGLAPFLFGMNPSAHSVEFTTAFGLALAAIGPEEHGQSQLTGFNARGNTLESMRRWIRQLFQPSISWSS